ncbi:12142_t:CDS:2, partial [Entrophospora sp. SA101]
MHESKKVQDKIAQYFTHARHSNVSPIYVSQRFFAVPKPIQENVTYISIHRGGGYFYNKLAETEDVSFKALPPSEIPDTDEFNPECSTVIIFEDLMHESKKVQDKIAQYFTHARHSNVSPIYVSQRFFAVPKPIQENVTYISIHRGGGSLFDLKNILNHYSDHLVPIIDDLTMKKEFI